MGESWVLGRRRGFVALAARLTVVASVLTLTMTGRGSIARGTDERPRSGTNVGRESTTGRSGSIGSSRLSVTSVGAAMDETSFERMVGEAFDKGRHWDALALTERMNAERRAAPGSAIDGERLRIAVDAWAEPAPVTVLFPLRDRLLVWHVEPGKVRGIQLALPRAEIQAWSEDAVNLVEHGGQLAPNSIAGRIAAQVLWRRDRSGTGGVEALVLPHGTLGQAPLGALLFPMSIDSDSNDADTAIAVSLLSTLVPARPAASRPRGGAFVFAPARLDGKPFLPAAAREVTRIAGLYKASTMYLDRKVTRERLSGSFQTASIVHFAGHASADTRRPEQTSLWLADGSFGRAEPSTLSELGRRGLNGLPLVFLSACSAGRASMTDSARSSSLADEFLDAGVRAVVASVTDIEDNVSADIAVRFHRDYAKGGSAPRALRQALEMAEPSVRQRGIAYQVFVRKMRKSDS